MPEGDIFRSRGRECLHFIRGLQTEDEHGFHSPVNDRSSFIDAATVYGHNALFAGFVRDKVNTEFLRENDLHDEDHRPFPPYTGRPFCTDEAGKAASAPCLLTGDPRSVTPALAVHHTMWLRYHNQLVRRLNQHNPTWDSEKLFQEARKIIVALHQKIAYYDYLPLIIGQDGLDHLGDYDPATGYDPEVDASVSPGFSAANR